MGNCDERAQGFSHVLPVVDEDLRGDEADKMAEYVFKANKMAKWTIENPRFEDGPRGIEFVFDAGDPDPEAPDIWMCRYLVAARREDAQAIVPDWAIADHGNRITAASHVGDSWHQEFKCLVVKATKAIQEYVLPRNITGKTQPSSAIAFYSQATIAHTWKGLRFTWRWANASHDMLIPIRLIEVAEERWVNFAPGSI